MGQPAEKLRRATYADLEAVPPHLVAEIINGELRTMPRPAPKHALTSTNLTSELVGPFSLGKGGPGGWLILDEPENHFREDVLVPDLAGWRVERMPALPETNYFEMSPDWVCEVLSPSTAAQDRTEKMAIYARDGVQYAWLIDPILKTIEVFVLSPERQWTLTAARRGDVRVHAEPFNAIELDLTLL